MQGHCVTLGCVLFLLQVAQSVDLEMAPLNPLVAPGQNVSLLCRAGVPFVYCRIKVPGIQNALNLSPKSRPSKEYAYFGAGLHSGQCGITLFSVGDKFNGIVTCTAATEEETEESAAHTTLTVLRTPKPPELSIKPSPITRNNKEFREGDVLQATCVVRDGRPVANISWYLGENVVTSGVRSVIETEEKTGLYTITQTMSRKLRWSDNAKELRCVAGHVAMGSKNQTSKTFNVTYPPRLLKYPIELYGFAVDKVGVVAVDVIANPKPQFVWVVGKSEIAEGQKEVSGNLEAMAATSVVDGLWKAVLHINKVTAEDIERGYYLKAKNALGETTNHIAISTLAEPPIKLGTGAIIGIIGGVVFLLTIFIIGYVMFSGRKSRAYVPSKMQVDLPPLVPHDSVHH